MATSSKNGKKIPRYKIIARRRRIACGVSFAILFVLVIILLIKEITAEGKGANRRPETIPSYVESETVYETEPETEEVVKTIGIGINEVGADGYFSVGDVKFQGSYTASNAENIAYPSEEDVNSEHFILMNPSTGEIVASRSCKTQMSPASMTKVLTILVAAEHIENLDETVTISREVTDFAYKHDCSSVGYLDGETVTVRELFYGTILPSGGDAALALAIYVAGSHEAFVDMMNEKVAELGLADTTHFTNCVGLYDKDHYSTAYDMAMIMKAAVENDWCREVLTEHVYTTAATEQHPEGITISNWFLRRIEDKDTDGFVMCAKTGYVVQSKNCAVSYAIQNDGKPYICVTAGAHSNWRAIYDHVALYKDYTP